MQISAGFRCPACEQPQLLVGISMNEKPWRECTGCGWQPPPKGVVAHRIGFSASRSFTADAVYFATDVIGTWVARGLYEQGNLGFITGAALGGDAKIGKWLLRMYPAASHLVVVPGNQSQVDYWWQEYRHDEVSVTWMPPASTYAQRNADIVRRADVLLAFPEYAEHDSRSRRSGTWQTIRMARKAKIEVAWWTLDRTDSGHDRKAA